MVFDQIIRQVVNVHIPMDLSLLRGLIRKRQGVLDNLARGLEAKGIRGEEQYHYTGETNRHASTSLKLTIGYAFPA